MTTKGRRAAIGAIGMCLAALFSVPGPAAGQQTKPVEIALWEGLQIHRPEADIAGLRLSIYGVNRSMSGIDIAFVGRTTAHQEGVFFGFASMSEGDFSGWQAAQFGNMTRGRISGAQTGLYNEAGHGVVAQAGILNRVIDDAVGLQLGLVNTVRAFEGARVGLANVATDEGHGVQIGLVNSVGNGSGFMLGLVNVADGFHGLQIGILNVIHSKARWPVIPIVNWTF